MKGFDVLKIKSAVKSHNKFDLSKTHLTTLNFGEIMPVYVEEVIPGDKFNISADYFSRMAPLAKPTYGKFSFKTVSAFVPYHQIAVDSDAWFAGKTSWEGTTPVQRYFTVEYLTNFIITYCTTTTGANQNNSVFTYTDSNGQTVYNVFTQKGKYYVKILNALGYTLPQGVDLQANSTWKTNTKNTKLSAYPLLAYFKLYNDYMSQSQRYNSSVLSDTLRKIKYNIAITNLYATTGELTNTCLNTLFTWLFLNYENDYFTSAWQQPNNAINSIENVASSNIPGHTNVVVDNTNDNVVNVPVVSSVASIGQRMLDFLKDFDNWVRRNNYSGSRAVQQIYSRFGIKTDDYKSHYAQVISTDTLPIQVGDITATGFDNSDEGLGSYCGKGIMSGSKTVSCQVSDYGIIIILGYFTVTPMNAFGYDRRVLRNSPLDYYNPEFDGIGADPISIGEVWASPIDTTNPGVTDNSIFGFTERYNAYRYGRDVITGEFRDYRNNAPMNVWHTGRNLETLRSNNNLVAQSTAMNTLPQTDSEYNRIFSIISGVVDHFYLTCKFKVNAIRPMLNLNQVPQLGEGDTTVPRNGNVIS